MKAQDFDRQFDEGKDITDTLDLTQARRPNLETRRVNVDFPAWMIERLDREAKRVGISRQAVIKTWVSQRLDGGDAAGGRIHGAGLPRSTHMAR